MPVGHSFIACFAICCTFLCPWVVCQPVWSMEKTDDIDTNRPSFMFSPMVLPKGSIQLENGTLYQHFDHGVTYYDIPETQVRVGLTERVEFEMFVPDFVLTHQSHTSLCQAGGSDLNEVGFEVSVACH